MKIGMLVWVASLMLCMTAVPGLAAVTANFDDGTWGDLDAAVNVSSRALTVKVDNYTHALPDADKELYISYAYGSPGQDKAVIDNQTLFTDIVASTVVGLYGTGYQGCAGGLAAGMPASGGSGYLLYISSTWDGGAGNFWDSTVNGGTNSSNWQFVLARKEAGSAYPHSAGNVFQALKLTGFTQDVPNFLRLTVNGNQVTGDLWMGQTAATGSPTASLSFTDATPLSGYTGAYLAGRNGQFGWGEAAVDDFVAVVPEPMTLALLAIGGLLIRRRTR
jgi:hypothetical protein